MPLVQDRGNCKNKAKVLKAFSFKPLKLMEEVKWTRKEKRPSVSYTIKNKAATFNVLLFNVVPLAKCIGNVWGARVCPTGKTKGCQGSSGMFWWCLLVSFLSQTGEKYPVPCPLLSQNTNSERHLLNSLTSLSLETQLRTDADLWEGFKWQATVSWAVYLEKLQTSETPSFCKAFNEWGPLGVCRVATSSFQWLR